MASVAETYAIQSRVSGMIKIGKCSPHTRRDRYGAAKRMVNEDCDWMGLLDVPERVAHEELHVYRRFGEWFEPAPKVTDYIFDHKVDA